MSWLNKLHERKTPPGFEVRIWKKLPLITILGTLAIAAMPVLVRILPSAPEIDQAKHIKTVDIFAIATQISLLTAVFTVAIGCVVVHIMKGPAYVADSLPVEHADRPAPGRERRNGTRD